MFAKYLVRANPAVAWSGTVVEDGGVQRVDGKGQAALELVLAGVALAVVAFEIVALVLSQSELQPVRKMEGAVGVKGAVAEAAMAAAMAAATAAAVKPSPLLCKREEPRRLAGTLLSSGRQLRSCGLPSPNLVC